MIILKSKAPRLAGVLVALLLLVACSAATKRRYLTFFFDGVPPEKTAPVADKYPAAGHPPPVPIAAPVVFTGTVHRPYQERQCTACHESQFSQKLRGTVGEVCLLCHKNFPTQPKFAHAPILAGYCLGCHNPHESRERFLLVRAGQQLCRDCHDKQDVDSVKAHAAIGKTECQQCHAPHGNDTRHFLRTTPPTPVSEVGP